ncbi:hypothetical protein [Mucilaginibacter sp. KACC 22773]
MKISVIRKLIEAVLGGRMQLTVQE